MMSDRDDDQLLTTNFVNDSVGPAADRTTPHRSSKTRADLWILQQQLEFSFDGFDEPFSITGPLLIVIVTRLEELATSLITNDENADHTWRAAHE